MSKFIVINTGPLIALQRINAIDIVGKLPFDFICPEEVREELDEGVRMGHPNVTATWLKILPLKESLSYFTAITLDTGEAAVIQLAKEQKILWVCIDEWKGRRAALASGLEVTGVLGLLGRAKRLGIIPEMKPFIQKALESGIRYDIELVNKVLLAANER